MYVIGDLYRVEQGDGARLVSRWEESSGMVTVLNVVEARVGTLAVRVNEYGEFWVNLYVCPSFGAWSMLSSVQGHVSLYRGVSDMFVRRESDTVRGLVR